MAEIPLALIADYANIAEGGKLNIMGVFDRIWARSFPASHPQLFLVLKLAAEPAEYNSEKTIEIKLLDADGHQVMSLSGKAKIGQSQGGRPLQINHLLRMGGLKFERPGDYVFVVLLNGDPKARIPLLLLQREAAAMEGQNG